MEDRSHAAVLPSRSTQIRFLGVFLLVLAPHALHVKPWVVLGLIALLFWRLGATLQSWPPLSRMIRSVLAISAGLFVYASFGRINGLRAGITLLLVLAGLKLTEMRDNRDVYVTVVLLYFILFTHFLFTQSLWMAAYLLFSAWLITAVLIDIGHPWQPLPLPVVLRISGVLTLSALPIMIALFVIFPRIPGPLWGLPPDSSTARTGLGDTMNPDDIRKLVLSRSVAFRVRFRGTPPPRNQRYWRGPVFTFYDGASWRQSPVSTTGRSPTVTLRDPAVVYTIIERPGRDGRLFAMDVPDPKDLPVNTKLGPDDVLRTTRKTHHLRLYRLRSYPDYVMQPSLSRLVRSADLELPPHIDPRARALARSWRQRWRSDAAIVRTALEMFHRKNFYYTLYPPPVGHNAIDDFLFHTRAGFCEHYASSFTFLMRAAGIPARVVTGYQGGRRNAIGDYYVVREADAHAWSEVWLDGRGWVRVDPTAAVSPARIDQGINAALADSPGLPSFLELGWRHSLRYALDARWDWLNTQWNQWVLGYGPELQRHLLQTARRYERRVVGVTLLIAITFAIALIGAQFKRRRRTRQGGEFALACWNRAVGGLARRGLVQQLGEGPCAFADRVCSSAPEVKTWIRALCAAYVRARYSDPDSASAQAELADIARKRPRRID